VTEAIPAEHAQWDADGDFRDVSGEKCNCELCQLAALRAAVIELAEIVRGHLAEIEARSDSITFGPEPSDHVAELIKRLQV
jgi:hypothetical protein